MAHPASIVGLELFQHVMCFFFVWGELSKREIEQRLVPEPAQELPCLPPSEDESPRISKCILVRPIEDALVLDDGDSVVLTTVKQTDGRQLLARPDVGQIRWESRESMKSCADLLKCA